MEQEYIPFFPRGRPEKAFDEYLQEVLIYANIDISRAIEPRLTMDEMQSNARPSDEVLFQRFSDRVLRWIGEFAGRMRVVLIIPWRVKSDQFLRSYLSELAYKLSKIPVGMDSRSVLLIEGHAAEQDFQRFSGVSFTERIWGTSYGSFFLLRWPASSSSKVQARNLRAFLEARIATDSILPPELGSSSDAFIHTSPTSPPPALAGTYPEYTREPEQPMRSERVRLSRSTSRFKAVQEILAPFQERASSDHDSDDESPKSDKKT